MMKLSSVCDSMDSPRVKSSCPGAWPHARAPSVRRVLLEQVAHVQEPPGLEEAALGLDLVLDFVVGDALTSRARKSRSNRSFGTIFNLCNNWRHSKHSQNCWALLRDYSRRRLWGARLPSLVEVAPALFRDCPLCRASR